jgi:hypothetical protein
MSERNSLDLESSSVAIGTRPGTGPIRVDGPDALGPNEAPLPPNGLLDPLSNREASSVALGSLGPQQPAYTAIGSNGHLMHGVHFHAHHDHHHRAKVSAGAPSIAGISDVSQSAGHHSRNSSTIKNSVPTMIGFGHAGDVLFVFDGRLQIGSTTVHGDGTWVFTTPALLNGPHDFSVATINPASGAMLTSNHLAVQVFAEALPAPTAIATITSALDEFTDPGGNHHQTAIQNGSTTPDTSPKLVGTLSASLHDGEVLYVYRDGQKLGLANVSGTAWSFQDADIAAGKHAYAVQVESATGAQGASSAEFSLTKAELTGSFDQLPVLVTENFLIVDIRLMGANSRGGAPATFDLEESVKFMKLQGLEVKSYTQDQDFITFEVDWIAYAAGHPYEDLMFVAHEHVDNERGGLDYYTTVGLASFPDLLRQLGTWVPTVTMADGAAMQSSLPPVDVYIGGVYDGLTLIPDGGSTSGTMHTLVGTLSDTIPRAGGDIVIYRDGVKIAANMFGFRWVTVTGTEWTFEDRDVPPGSHVYTAQIERTYGKQGAMSGSYNILGINHETPQDSSSARMLMTGDALTIDVRNLVHSNSDGSVTSVGLKAEVILANQTVIALLATSGENGSVPFEADWTRLTALHPDAKLKITTEDGMGSEGQILDVHTLRALWGQMNHWVTATPDGESAAFFNVSDRSTHIHGGAGVNTIAIADDHQVLDLTSLTGKTTASMVMGIEKIDLGGQHNTLKIAMIDVLNLGETDLFREDGKQQLMVNGKAGDSVKLSNTRVAGIADGNWEQQAETKIGGVTYDVYEHSTAHVELMVQSGIQLTML